MTTQVAAALYLAQHLLEWQEKGYTIFNPHNKPVEELPVIYGFNNGGSLGWFSGQLLAEDGKALGGHICSHEGYMPHDLGIADGARPDRHEVFREHFPNGYRMDFVSYAEVESHPGLKAAISKNQADREASHDR